LNFYSDENKVVVKNEPITRSRVLKVGAPGLQLKKMEGSRVPRGKIQGFLFTEKPLRGRVK